MEIKTSIDSKREESAGPDHLGRIVQILLVAYLVATPFQNIWDLPYVGHKIQPPEFIFIVLFFVAVPHFIRNRQKLWFSPIDVGVLGWLAVNIIVGLIAGLNFPIFLELLGSLYLTLMYYVVRLTISENLVKKFPDCIALTAMVSGLIGIVGWCLAAAGIENNLIDAHVFLPLLGKIYGRAMAFTQGNNLLAHILMMGILIKAADCWHKNEFSPRNLIVLGTLLIAFMVTFSKTGLILLIGLILVWYFSTNQRENMFVRIPTWTTVLILFLMYNFVALFHPTWKDDPNLKTISPGMHRSSTPIASAGPFDIMVTRYGYQVVACVMAFKESFPWGIGPGEFKSYASRIAKEGVFQFRQDNRPDRIWPHSTYFGGLAQLGVLGVLSILVLWGLIGYGCRQIYQVEEYRGWAIGLAVSFFTTAITAIFVDIMNFRHLWWLVAVLAVLWHYSRLKKISHST
ncbi:MAG: hypothetical protein HOB18_03485 [Nitrospina sp.]|nr:hypothetical protein [Nitrospina sp.]